MTVELITIVEQMAEVCEQLEVVVDSRRSPNLRRVAQIRIARVDDVRRVLALDGAVGRLGGAVLHADVAETVLSQRHPDVAGYGKRPTVSADSVTRVLDVADDARPARRRVPRIGIEEAPGLDFQAASRGIVLQLEVNDSGDGVRAVLRRRAVAQHLNLPNGNRWNDGDVRSLRAVGDAISQPSDDRRAVAALSVDQDQRVVGRQVAQVSRTDDGPRIADRLSVDVEGGDDSPQLGYQIPAALSNEVLGTDDVHGHGGLGHRSWRGAAADDHDGRGDSGQFEHKVSQDRLAGNQFDVIGDASLEAGILGRNRVDPGLQSQFVCASGIRRTGHLGSGGVVGRRYFRAWDD